MSTTEFTFQSDVAPPVPIHRFTVEQYHALGEQGLLGPEDRVELLEGLIVQKINQLPPHSFAVRYLDHWLQSIVADGWLIQCQLPITLSTSEPEPDLAVLRGSLGDFMKRHPSGEDCRLVIEVADSSLSRDLGKAAIYASAGVEEYWIVKIANKSLLRMRQPSEGIYQETSELLRDESIDFLLGDHSVSFPLSDLFPE